MSRLRSRVLNAAPARLALFAAIWLSLFLYAGRPLLVGAAAAGMARPFAWATLLLCAALPLLPFFSGRKDALRHRSLAHWTGYATLAVFSLLLTLVFLSDVLRVLYVFAQWLLSARAWPVLDPRAISFTILGGAAALSLVGLVQARCPRVRNVRVTIDDLPPQLDGYRIAQWSDVHVGPTIQRGFVQSLVERTNALNVDAVAITGDLVDGYLDDLRDQVQPLADLRARDGVFYVTGNHEYYWRASEWVREVEKLGANFLKNAHRVIERDGAQIVFAGVTDPVGRDTHKQDPHRALANAPDDAVKILLSHRPQTAQIASDLGVHLQLSGHTHGGQFFPFNLMIHWFQPIVAGLHKVGRTWLYVNRGTGYWGPPSRLGVHGEITVLELTR
ncbi:MAG TPA: metallophosphoesterase [Thermoanaerobaculia bacterium]|nr:metallophosphoesterase [Thermoanaerobaculia bacterium]